MVTQVFTWIGAVLGIVVLLAMATGTFIVDFSDARSEREWKTLPDDDPAGAVAAGQPSSSRARQ
jgi:hypothetical protein